MLSVNPYTLQFHTGSFRLNPHETAKQNLWRCISQACSLLIAKRIHKLIIMHDELEELMSDFCFLTYSSFISNKVMRHGYNRRFSFFQNVFSSAYSVLNRALTKHFKRIEYKSSTAERIMFKTGITELTINPMPKYAAPYERKKSRRDLAERCRAVPRQGAERREAEEWENELAEIRYELFGDGYKPTPIKKKLHDVEGNDVTGS